MSCSGLTTSQVERFGSIREANEALWVDIEALGKHFWATRDDDRVKAWHHLLLACGNFKRQGGTKIYPARLPQLPDAVPDLSFIIPGTDLEVQKNRAKTWQHLETINGLSLPTASAVLACIWPDDFVIMDINVHLAALGLAAAADHVEGSPLAETGPMGTSSIPLEWSPSYEWGIRMVRIWAAEVKVKPKMVERCLYNLYRNLQDKNVSGRSWRDFGLALLKVARATP